MGCTLICYHFFNYAVNIVRAYPFRLGVKTVGALDVEGFLKQTGSIASRDFESAACIYTNLRELCRPIRSIGERFLRVQD